MVRDRPYFPVLLIVCILAASLGVLGLWAATRGRGLVPVSGRVLGEDYRVFHDASQALRAGRSPYVSQRYVTPPLPAIVNWPLSLLAFEVAAWVIVGLSVGGVLLCVLLATVSRFDLRSRDAKWVLALSVGAMALSYPLWFLLYRGNIDAFVLVPMCLAVWWSGRRQVLAGLCLAVAMALKVYPVLLVVPLLVCGRRRTVVSAAVCLAVFVALAPGLWVEGGARLLWRSSCFEMAENASITCTLVYVGEALGGVGLPLGRGVWRLGGLVVYGVLLLLCTYADYVKRGRRSAGGDRAAAMMYFPFMVAMPELVFHYSLVVLLPLVPMVAGLWRRRGARADRVLTLLAVGLALSQWQAEACARLVGNIVPHFVPGVGLLVVLVACTWYKLRC